MAFDLSSVLNQAQEVTSQQQNSDKSKVRLIYPSTGTLKVKLLYNPKSNLVARQIRRHKVGNTNYVCLSSYGVDCPICKTIDSIKNATGVDAWQLNAKTRGISYAQYIGSEGYKWDTKNPEPQIGELVLLMYPWTIYQDINRIISTAGIHANELIATNTGKIFKIIRWRENSQEKYRGELDAFNTYTTISCNINDPNDVAKAEIEFDKYLSEIPNLSEAVIPAAPNEDTYKYANEASEALSRDYLKGTGYNGMSQMMNQQFSGNISGTPSIIDDGHGNKFVLVNGQYVKIVDNVSPQNNGFNVVPSQVTPVSQQFQSPQVQTPPQISQAVPPVQSTPGVQIHESVPPQSSPTNCNNEKMPDCFGKHSDTDVKCTACVYELQCMTCKE